jgi:hypothetical protein
MDPKENFIKTTIKIVFFFVTMLKERQTKRKTKEKREIKV